MSEAFDFQPFWENLLSAHAWGRTENRDELPKLVRFYIAPQRGSPDVYLFHILAAVRIEVGESLPEDRALRFRIVHFYWRANPAVNKKLPNFEAQRKKIEGAATQFILSALLDGTSPAPFLAPAWWQRLEMLFFLPGKVPAGKAQELKSEMLVLKADGKALGGSAMQLPPESIRRAFCRHIAAALPIRPLRERLLCQRRRSGEQTGFTPPLHIGWTETGSGPVYHGITAPGESGCGSALMRRNTGKPDGVPDIGKIFELVPPETAVPLLAFSVFSVIKPFVPGYPARVSDKEPFAVVRKKQERLFFLTLKGENARETAAAFCGAFTDYGAGEEVPPLKLRQSRVHDGVVVLDSPFRSFSAFLDNQLVRDACVLCTDAAFEENSREIVVWTKPGPSAKQLETVGEIVTDILLGFAGYAEELLREKTAQAHRSCLNEIFDLFRTQYEAAGRHLKISTDERLDGLERRLAESKTDTWETVGRAVSALDGAFGELTDEAEKMYRPYLDVARKLRAAFGRMARELIREHKGGFSLSLADLESAEAEPKYAYLCAAVSALCGFFRSAGMPDDEADRLRELSLRALRSPGRTDSAPPDPVECMRDYLSAEIARGGIIRVRTPENAETSGWYDGRKGFVYLPYETYFRRLSSFWESENGAPFPYEKGDLQQKLADAGALYAAKNGGSSTRADCKMVVGPPGVGKQEPVRVIKVQAGALGLSEEDAEYLEKLSAQEVPRRSASVKG